MRQRLVPVAATPDVDVRPQFVELPSGRLFVVHFPADVAPERSASLRVLFVPPFAEELNKSRRMCAVTARALSKAGIDALVPDLAGTGDSDGELHETPWEAWARNVAELDGWFAGQSSATSSCWLTVRSGLLVAAAALNHGSAAPGSLIAWQPVNSGATLLGQFLRLRVMSARMAGRDESVKALQSSLADGDEVEVAGYRLAATFTDGLGSARAKADALAAVARIRVIEMATSVGADVGRSIQTLVNGLTSEGCDAQARVVHAEQFWTTQEIAAPDEVRDATVASALELAAIDDSPS